MKKKPAKKPDNTLRELLVQKLGALLDIESEIVKALPKMIEAASDENLKKGFRDHLAETRNHVCRIEDAFGVMNEKPKKLKVEAIRGLANDAKWVMQNVRGEDALDANLIAAARYVEHYEMAGYLAALKWAETLNLDNVADLLSATLVEEQKADNILASASALIDEKAIGSDSE